jgi:hypothetical protein
VWTHLSPSCFPHSIDSPFAYLANLREMAKKMAEGEPPIPRWERTGSFRGRIDGIEISADDYARAYESNWQELKALFEKQLHGLPVHLPSMLALPDEVNRRDHGYTAMTSSELLRKHLLQHHYGPLRTPSPRLLLAL